jgi:hypothetical protein
MTKNLFSLAAALIALGLASSPALAGASRTFVSGSPAGSDTGTCAISAPCRTFAYALTQTAPSGEIIVLSSGGYGTVTINQAVSIINTSSFAGVTVPTAGNGITINAQAGDSVTLRGLTVDGVGTGSNGIVFNSGGNLTIDQCNLMNFVSNGGTNIGNGIWILPTSDAHTVTITNTTTSNNAFAGVLYFPTSASTATTGIVIDRVNANNNGAAGIQLFNFTGNGAVSASISNTIVSENPTGFRFNNLTVSVDLSTASGNGTEAINHTAGTLTLGRSSIVNNSLGVRVAGGTVNSYKNNQFSGNAVDVSGSLTPVNLQ